MILDRVTQFAVENAYNNEEFGEDARLAFRRHLNDLERSKKNKDEFPYKFDPKRAEEVINLANNMTIAEGFEEEKFTCYGFQEFILGSLFGWLHKTTENRRFTDSYIQLSRQQGKSILNGILGVKCSNFDGYNYGQIYCTATKQDQANIVLNEMIKFIRADKDLEELFEIKEYNHKITALLTNSIIRALGRDTGSIDGFRPYLGIIDEYHAHKNNQMYKLLKGGTRRLKQFLISVITTAGFNLNGPCYELYKYCRRVLRGIDQNDRQFIYIAQMDDNDDIWDPKNWIKCCPLTGKDKETIENMKVDADKARSMGGEELRDFLTKSLNIWVTSYQSKYIDLKAWEECASHKTLSDFRGKKAVCGLDLSSGGDLTSLSLEFPYSDDMTGDKKYFIYSHSFIPKARMQEHMEMEDNAPYVIWEREGLLTATTAAGGIKTDYKAIIRHLLNLIEEFEIEIAAIAYDPHNASAFLADLEVFDCDLIEIKQSARSLNDATIDFALEVKSGNIEYEEDNQLLTRSINDAILNEPNSFGEVKIDKMTQKNRIDPVDSVICSHKVAISIDLEELDINAIVDDFLEKF